MRQPTTAKDSRRCTCVQHVACMWCGWWGYTMVHNSRALAKGTESACVCVFCHASVSVRACACAKT